MPARKARAKPQQKAAVRSPKLLSLKPGSLLSRVNPIVAMGRIWDDIGHRFPIEFRVPYRRPDDLLVCDFIFDNLKREDAQLVRVHPEREATLIVEFPPQSFAEQAFLDRTGPEVSEKPKQKFQESSDVEKNQWVPSADPLDKPLPFANVRMSGPSRIAFSMPANEVSLGFTAAAILDACRRWPMRLDINAKPEPPRRPYIEIEPRFPGILDKSWLQQETLSGGWTTTKRVLAEATAAASNVGEQTLVPAAERIARQAVGKVGAGTNLDVRESLIAVMNSEMDAISANHPALKEPGNREIAMATLSVLATESFANLVAEDFKSPVTDLLPFLPVLLAPHKPSATVTALELPYRLVLSPVPPSNWWHSIAPVVRNGRTELWHTRLTNAATGKGPDAVTHVRALWSPDYELEYPILVYRANERLPFRMSLDALDRQMLVKLMSGFNEQDDDGYTYLPRAARSSRLSLSALGALVDVEGTWDFQPELVGLEQWRHLGSLGRDHYVRVVYKGFLLPFRHAASLIKVTERKFEDHLLSGKRVAVLRQRFFIIVRQPVMSYDGNGHIYDGKNFPFPTVEVLTKITPSLSAPDQSKLSDPTGIIYSSAPDRACFWPKLGSNNYFNFQLAATDLCGNRSTFSMPLLFVGKEANSLDPVIAEIIKRYNDKSEEPRRTPSFKNATICYAPHDPDPDALGDTQFPTSRIRFRAEGVTGIPKREARFYPEIEMSDCGIAAIQRLLGDPTATTEVTYADIYKKEGFSGSNKGEIFLKTLKPYELAFGDKVKSEALGGIATPAMAIQGLSRIMGPVAAQPKTDVEQALKNVYENKFDPVDFFKDAKILGGIPLSEIISGALSLAGAEVPKLLSRNLVDRIEARFDWATTITKSDLKGLFVPNAGGATKLEMHGVVSSPIAQPTATTFTASASLVNFKINLFGFIIIWFDRLKFESKTGSKQDVVVDLHPGDEAIVFGGPLEFVNELRNIIPSNGFSDPPGISVTPSGLSASYSLNIPTVAVGIFALEHMSIGASFLLPFDSKPAEVRFNFCERQRPFSLTVAFLGGGGFFAIGVGADGVKVIEAALEFGAGIAIDLGVASGSVEIKAGVYFRWAKSAVELAGYVRLHGELSVLGLISASLTFNLQLAYLKEGGRSVVWGEASLEVEIEILFVSFSVSVSVRKEFGGSDSDPKFIELIPDLATWDEYCRAFALEAA